MFFGLVWLLDSCEGEGGLKVSVELVPESWDAGDEGGAKEFERVVEAFKVVATVEPDTSAVDDADVGV